MKLVDKSLDIPLHIQLSQIIKEMIENKELLEGVYLESERELSRIQNISRMTVNKAIISLVNEGLLERKQGKGTFVAYKKQKYKFQNLKGFTEVINDKGLKVKNKILSFEVSKQNDAVRKKLQIENKEEQIYKIVRIRFIEDEPFAIETVYIPKRMCEDLTEDLVKNNSLYKLFKEKYNHRTKEVNQTIEPIILDKKNANILNRKNKSLALKFNRVLYTFENEILEYTISIFTTDKYQYEILLTD